MHGRDTRAELYFASQSKKVSLPFLFLAVLAHLHKVSLTYKSKWNCFWPTYCHSGLHYDGDEDSGDEWHHTGRRLVGNVTVWDPIWGRSSLAHCCAIFICLTNIWVEKYIFHHRNPNNNGRDHLVGQLTRSSLAIARTLNVISANMFYPPLSGLKTLPIPLVLPEISDTTSKNLVWNFTAWKILSNESFPWLVLCVSSLTGRKKRHPCIKLAITMEMEIVETSDTPQAGR